MSKTCSKCNKKLHSLANYGSDDDPVCYECSATACDVQLLNAKKDTSGSLRKFSSIIFGINILLLMLLSILTKVNRNSDNEEFVLFLYLITSCIGFAFTIFRIIDAIFVLRRKKIDKVLLAGDILHFFVRIIE
ncbi:MAG: hypothetical protein JW915_10210 [Chitinispirillaceae bacterium]|nr:hypothetical protein [Chitinispirillaceae bacterium]